MPVHISNHVDPAEAQAKDQSLFSSPSLKDPNKVYADYLSYYRYIVQGIVTLQNELATLTPGSPQYAAAQAAISSLAAIESGPLLKAFEAAYASGDAADFEQLWTKTLKPEVDALISGHVPPVNPNAQKIEDDLEKAQQLLATLLKEIAQDRSDYNSLESKISQWETAIADLSGKVSGNPQAQQGLKTAETQLSVLKEEAAKMASALQTLGQAESEIAQLQQLALKTDPSDADAAKADAILAQIQGQLNALAKAQSDFAANDPSADVIRAMNAAIRTVENDLGSPVAVSGQTAYIDLGCMSGMNPAAIAAIVANLEKAGIAQIDISFAQVSDPSTWNAGDAETFKQIVANARAAGMKVDLSFGGYNGSMDPKNWEVKDPSALAQQLANYVQTMGLDGLDFDYEGSALPPPYQDNLLEFFQNLRLELRKAFPAGQVPPMTLTVMAGPSNSVGSPDGTGGYSGGPIHNLFANFSSCFDGLNLMMYGGPEYLTGNPNYLQMWIGNKGDGKGIAAEYGIPAGEVHVGFMDYSGPNAGGYPGLGTDGQNAAQAYLSALSALGYSTTDLGTTFWWPNEGFNKHPGDSYAGVLDTLEEEIADFNRALH